MTLKRKLSNVSYQLICPEIEIGLGTPRPPIRIYNGRYVWRGEDITDKINKYIKQLINNLPKIERFIGTKNSPCCDPCIGALGIALREIGIKTGLS